MMIENEDGCGCTLLILAPLAPLPERPAMVISSVRQVTLGALDFERGENHAV